MIGELLELERGSPADPTTREGFIRIESSLATMMKRQAAPAQEATMRRLSAMVAFPPGTEGGIAAFEQGIEDEILGLAAPTTEAVSGTIDTSTRSIYARTRRSLRRRVRLGALDFRFSRADHEAVRSLQNQHTFYVRNSFGSIAPRSSARARRIVAGGLKSGLGTREIGAQLEAAIVGKLRMKGYMDTLASLFVNRSRTTSELNSYSRVGIELFRFEAVLDERTTEVCHFLHGKIFSVGQARAAINRVGQLPDPRDVKFALPFLRQFKDKDGEPVIGLLTEAGRKRVVAQVLESGQGHVGPGAGKYDQKITDQALQNSGVGPPPAHFRCRSDAVPV